MSIKISLKKLTLPCPISTFVESEILGKNIHLMSIKPIHTFHLTDLPFHLRDPFDRMLITQSLCEDVAIIK